MRIVVVADTHVPDFARSLPGALYPELRRADLVLHAGDVTAASVLDEIAQYAPVRAVVGNNDGPDVVAWGAVPEHRFELEGLEVAMVHDSGPRAGRERRLRRRFPGAGLVVFGHSHIPVWSTEDGVAYLNPGSPTWKRRQPAPSFARLTVSDGRPRARIIELPV